MFGNRRSAKWKEEVGARGGSNELFERSSETLAVESVFSRCQRCPLPSWRAALLPFSSFARNSRATGLTCMFVNRENVSKKRCRRNCKTRCRGNSRTPHLHVKSRSSGISAWTLNLDREKKKENVDWTTKRETESIERAHMHCVWWCADKPSTTTRVLQKL